MFHGSTGAETKLSKRKKTKKRTASPVVITACTSAETTLKADACFSWLLLQLDARRRWQLTKADGKKIFAMEGPVPFFHLYRHFQWVQWFQNNNNRGQAGCGPSVLRQPLCWEVWDQMGPKWSRSFVLSFAQGWVSKTVQKYLSEQFAFTEAISAASVCT